MKRPLLAALIGAASLAGLALVGMGALMLALPDARSILKPCVTAAMNNVKVCRNQGNWASLAAISPNLRNAVILSEDSAFFSHTGIDTDELKESLKHDIEKGRFARGASTITQQLAKNVFLSKEKTISRKVKEIYLAFQIEKILTKNQILELYLNVVEFGPEIYGARAAARFYFKKQPSDLTPYEGAFLAFLLPNPKKYSQSYFHGKLTPFARGTISRILGRMAKTGRIGEEEHRLALASLPYFPWKEGIPADATPVAVSPESPEGGEEAPPEESVEGEDDFRFDMNQSEEGDSI